MEKEYIKVSKPSPLPNYISEQRDLSDDVWQNLVFYHVLSFYKNHDTKELKEKINKEKRKKSPRTEREIVKFMRKYLKNNREFCLQFGVYGEVTNDEDVEGNYDVIINNTYWQKDFHFECKNLNKSQDLINKYVFYKMTPTKNDGGVYRYFNGKYALNQTFGGMIGFVLEGDVQIIKNKIIQKMKSKFDISPNGDLVDIELDSIEKNDFTFNSIHSRNTDKFKIHHLLFSLL